MATKSTKSSPAVKTIVAQERGEKTIVEVGQHKLLILNPDVIMVFATHHSSDKRIKHTELHKLVALGALVSAPGVEKCIELFTTLKNEVQRRSPEGWRNALEAVKLSRIKVEVKGSLPTPDQMSQLQAEIAQPEMVSEPTNNKTPEEGEKEKVMLTIEMCPESELVSTKTGKPLTGGARLAKAEAWLRKQQVVAAGLFANEEVAEAVVAPPAETKEGARGEPKEEVMKTEAPEGSLAAQIRAMAPKLGMKVEAPTLTSHVPAIMTSIREGTQYRDLSELKEEDVRAFVGTLSPKKQWTEGSLLVEVTKTFRARAIAQEKALNEAGKARVEGIKKAVKETYGEAVTAFLKIWHSDSWKAKEQPSTQAVHLTRAEENCLSKSYTVEGALPLIQEAAKKDFDSWIVKMEEERAPRVGHADLLARRVNNLSPDAAQGALKELKLGTNPAYKPLLNFFVRRIQGHEVAVTPDVYRAALALPEGVLKGVFQAAYAAMDQARRQAAEQAEEVVAQESAKVAGARKAEIEEALKETAPEAPQAVQEAEVTVAVVEEPKVTPVPQQVVEEVVGQVCPVCGSDETHTHLFAEETTPPAEPEVVPDATITEPQAKAIKPDAETLKGLRKLNAFFVRQTEKVKAKTEQFGDWVRSKEPKKPTPKALRRETQRSLEQVLALQPKEGLAFLELKTGEEMSDAVKAAFEVFVSAVAQKKMEKAGPNWRGKVYPDLNKKEYPALTLTPEFAWVLEIAFRLWLKRGGQDSDEALVSAFRAIKGLPGRHADGVITDKDLNHIVVSLFDQLEWYRSNNDKSGAGPYPAVWSADQMRVLEAISAAKEAGKVKLKDGSYVAHHSYHAAIFLAKGLFGFVSWMKLPFRAALQLVGGSAWGAISAKKGERTAAARKAVRGAWEKVYAFAWVLPSTLVRKAWKKVTAKFAKKVKTQAEVQKEALETKGQWERALEGVLHMFDVVRKVTTKVVEAGKADKAKSIGAAIGAAVGVGAALLLGAGIVTTASLVAAGATLGWFAKRAWGWTKGLVSKKAEAPVAPASA